MAIYYRLIKKSIVLLCVMIYMHSSAQYATTVTLSDVNDLTLEKKMATNASNLLTTLNSAFFNNKTPMLDGLDIDPKAVSSILSLWETSIFRCYETEIITRVSSKPNGGYEIRNIPLFMKEADTTEQYQEAVINFNKQGKIEDLYIALETQQVNNILKTGITVTDFRRRQIILDFIENFRTAYNRKDIVLLNKVFSDDALIITGTVIKTQQSSDAALWSSIPKEKIAYTRLTKSQYISGLKAVFARNSYINIKFDSIEIVQHKKYPEIYGITLMQDWNTSNYKDVGYLFLMIDFADEDNPIIHVRTWQPDKVNNESLKKEEVFNLGMFNIKK